MWLNSVDLGIEHRPDKLGALFIEMLPEELKLVMVHLEADDFDGHQREPVMQLINVLLHHYEFDVVIWAGARRRLMTMDKERFHERQRKHGTWIDTETGKLVQISS